MNTKQSNTDLANANVTADNLPNLGFTGDDVRRQLSKTAQSGIQQIAIALEAQYHLRAIPDVIHKSSRKKAQLIYIRYCEDLINDLRQSAGNPDMKL